MRGQPLIIWGRGSRNNIGGPSPGKKLEGFLQRNKKQKTSKAHLRSKNLKARLEQTLGAQDLAPRKNNFQRINTMELNCKALLQQTCKGKLLREAGRK